jgi:hypothetical protein
LDPAVRADVDFAAGAASTKVGDEVTGEAKIPEK